MFIGWSPFFLGIHLIVEGVTPPEFFSVCDEDK